MADTTASNDQITDSISQTNTKVLGDAPETALGSLYQATAQALANAAQNAVASQQQANELAQAATARCVEVLLGDRAGAPASTVANAMNEQAGGAVAHMNASLKNINPKIIEALAYPGMVQAVVMALQNRMFEQQLDHILRNALTTAAASALLAGKREEAEAVLKLADERLGRQNLSEEIAKLGDVLENLLGHSKAR